MEKAILPVSRKMEVRKHRILLLSIPRSKCQGMNCGVGLLLSIQIFGQATHSVITIKGFLLENFQKEFQACSETPTDWLLEDKHHLCMSLHILGTHSLWPCNSYRSHAYLKKNYQTHQTFTRSSSNSGSRYYQESLVFLHGTHRCTSDTIVLSGCRWTVLGFFTPINLHLSPVAPGNNTWLPPNDVCSIRFPVDI